MKYILAKGYHQRFEGVEEETGKMKRVLYRYGDEIDLTKAEVKKLGDRVKPVVEFREEEQDDSVVSEPARTGVEVPETPTPDEAEAADAAEETVGSILSEHGMKVKSFVRQTESIPTLVSLYTEEELGKARDTVLEEIQSRIDQLQEDGE